MEQKKQRGQNQGEQQQQDIQKQPGQGQSGQTQGGQRQPEQSQGTQKQPGQGQGGQGGQQQHEQGMGTQRQPGQGQAGQGGQRQEEQSQGTQGQPGQEQGQGKSSRGNTYRGSSSSCECRCCDLFRRTGSAGPAAAPYRQTQCSMPCARADPASLTPVSPGTRWAVELEANVLGKRTSRGANVRTARREAAVCAPPGVRPCGARGLHRNVRRRRGSARAA